MAALIIYDGPGPLPKSATFTAPLDGPAVFALSGTARTSGAPCIVEVSLSLDGALIGKPALCWFNQNDFHMALRPTYINVDNLTFGEHTIEISNSGGQTITDVNDYFQVVLLY
jgi:hypothetical protein